MNQARIWTRNIANNEEKEGFAVVEDRTEEEWLPTQEEQEI